MTLPKFRYHPDPIATGSVIASDNVCKCCERQRGYVYTEPPHCPEELEQAICPWCIADGSAATKFDCTFVPDSDQPLPEPIHSELFCRTPGFWYGNFENWLCHCDDACEFHGRLAREDLHSLSKEHEDLFLEENEWVSDWWEEFKQEYDPDLGGTGLFKFVCRHCGTIRIGVDLD